MRALGQYVGRAAAPARAAGLAAGMLMALGAGSAPGAEATPEVTLYEVVPSADEMAAVLLGAGSGVERGGRTRSIRMKPEAASEPASGILGFAVHFALDSDRIEPVDHPFLDELARVMEMPDMEGHALVVEGHTDARGAAPYNDALSLRRARSVIAYLADVHGIERSRLIPAGRGEREPLDHADPAAGVNRRVQFYLPGAK